MERGVLAAAPDAFVHRLAIADGGDGTIAALAAAGAERVKVRVASHGAVQVAVVIGPPRTAVVEVAQVGGLEGRRPTAQEARAASSWGAGALIRAALDGVPSVDRLVVGVGGTASTDAGAGALVALGARLLDASGAPVRPGLAGLFEVDRIDLSALDPRVAGARRSVELVVATDVDSRLNGPRGAAALFGPQKGLPLADVDQADRAMGRFAALLSEATGYDVARLAGSGAGGGLGAGLSAISGRPPRPGADIVFELVGLDQALATSDVVVTAEGSLDQQSSRGKAPVALARRARRAGVPCAAVAGSVALSANELAAEGIVDAIALLDLEPDVDRAMAGAAGLVEAATAELVRRWLLRSTPSTGGGRGGA